MNLKLGLLLLGGALCVSACTQTAPTPSAADKAAADAAAESAKAAAAAQAKQVQDVAEEAYIYGYPLVTMHYTQRVMTNVDAVGATRGPMGQFVRVREYPSSSYRDVTAPNADTLYTTIQLDVGPEPWIIEQPDMKGRFFLMPMLDGWTNVFDVPGKRTTGTDAQVYAITGPGWTGTLPEGVTQYKSPTSIVWLLGRIYCTGTPEDYKAVHALQDKFTAVPLSSYGKPYTPPAATVDASIDMKTPVRDQVHALDGTAYFSLLATLLKTNPPTADDAPMVAKLASIGIVPGQDFDPAKLDATQAAAIAAAPKPAQEKIMGWFKGGIAAGDSTFANGWLYSLKTGLYGTNYIQRAFVTAIGLGANRPEDAVYPTSEADAQEQAYDGANKYVMHFNKGELPPVNGFWSLTMYDENYFFVENPLNRYSISLRNKLKENPDGSIDLLIQNESPGKALESNWLPAPKGKFILMMRLYWPKDTPPSILDGSWKVPPVTKAG